ncbi:MAG: polysaccharide deacetylase family protein [Oscillospiraceae bacterium]|nr:polysaccharide deacetylase family protein [Oscillospiraceae bacterium]
MKKKLLALILLICMSAFVMPLVSTAETPELAEAVRADGMFFVDGKNVKLRAYEIEENIYVNLFEVALALNDTEKQYSLAWRMGGQALRIIGGMQYRAIAVSLARANINRSDAIQTKTAVFLFNEEIEVTSYKVGTDTYFNLKEFAKAMDFNIVTCPEEGSVELVTGMPYEEDLIIRRNIDPELPMVALTFDDGPVKYTDQILDILERHDAVATFYVIGSQVNTWKDTMLRAVEMGCEIGNHTMNHRNLRKQNDDGIRRQIVDANDAIEAITGVKPLTMRPPWGEMNDTSRAAMGWLGMPIVTWSIDPLDWLTKDAYTTHSRVMEAVRDGDIILLHDTHSSTVTATSLIVSSLLNRGYQLVTVSELFHFKEVDPVAGRTYTAVRG